MFRKLFNARFITAVLFASGVAALILASIQGVAAKETTKKAWLGVHIQELTPSLREAMKLGDKTGLLITEVVDDSPADDANLREEDVIIEFNGQPVERADAFTKLVRNSEPGKEVKIVVMRDGVRKEIMVTLAARKTPKSYSYAFGGAPMRFFSSHPQLGVQAHELNADLAAYFNVKQDGGALVLEVMDDTPAEKAGLKAGDVITKIDDETIEDPEDLVRALSDYEEDDEITITYVRHGKSATTKATLEENAGPGFHFFQAPRKDRTHIELRRFDDDDEAVLFAPRPEKELRDIEREVIEARDRVRLHPPRAPLPPGFLDRESI